MNKTLFFIISILKLINVSYSQECKLEVADRFLASNFKAFYSAKTEIKYCMAPIVEEKIISHLKDSSSFNYPYDSLSKYIQIETSEDSMVRAFSWDRISGGSWHDMASYVQFKSESGKIKCQRLDSGDESATGEPTDVIIYDVHHFYIENESYYLLLGRGTHGSGQHHSLARVIKISGETLSLCDSIFEGQEYLFVEANRINKIDLEYNAETKSISFYRYEFNENEGFYESEGKKEEWILEGGVFIKKNL